MRLKQLSIALFAAGFVSASFAQSVDEANNATPVLGVLSKTTAIVTPAKQVVPTNIVVPIAQPTPVASAPTSVAVANQPSANDPVSGLREVTTPRYMQEPVPTAATASLPEKSVSQPAAVSSRTPAIGVPEVKPEKRPTPVTASKQVAQATKATPVEPVPIKLKPLAPVTSLRDEITLPPPPPSPLEAENLPGLGLMPGASPDLSNKVVKSGNERNEVSYISATFPNRIATAFQSPHVIDQSGATIQVDGSDIYITPTTPSPIAIYIVDDITHQTVSMTLVPKNMPAQTIIAEMQTQKLGGDDKALAALPEEYTSKLSALNLQVAQNRLPSGFTEARLPAATTRIANFTVRPLTRYSGAYYDVFKYEITSGYRETVELKEDAFYNDEHIRTISFFPATVLEPGQNTTMVIVSDKPKSEKSTGLRF